MTHRDQLNISGYSATAEEAIASLTLNEAERAHVVAKGDAFLAALAKAAMSVRTDGRLVGLHTIRERLALRAALKATGFSYDPLSFPPGAGQVYPEIQAIVDDVFHKAVEAARRP